VLYHLAETLRLVALQLMPFMPGKMSAMLSQIQGAELSQTLTFASHGGWGLLKSGHQCEKPQPLFPRMD